MRAPSTTRPARPLFRGLPRARPLSRGEPARPRARPRDSRDSATQLGTGAASPAAPGLAQGNPDHAMRCVEARAALRPHQNGKLLAKGQVLKDQVGAGVAEDSKGLEQDGQHQVQCSHGSAGCPRSGTRFKDRSRSALRAASELEPRKLQHFREERVLAQDNS